ncbi:uncharacterized protein LOC122851892 [Aphidius gifuensis]|uniref:uncharacterized protein LOC122851892 n=1 Tax=Aphidius gifuensis TaxID=684658 RepID=UPI001CDB58B4|nr:uncharacterized protein LOC122851892 [Aphidius gifuensis]
MEDLAIVRICNATDSVDISILNDYMLNHDFNTLENHQLRQLSCFLLCIYSEYNWMDHHGSFKIHNIKSWMHRAKLPTDHIEILLKRCITSELTDPCTRARHFTECFWSNHQGIVNVNHRHTLHSIIRKKDAE